MPFNFTRSGGWATLVAGALGAVVLTAPLTAWGGGMGCRVVWFSRGATVTDLLVLGLLVAGWACLRRLRASAPPGDS